MAKSDAGRPFEEADCAADGFLVARGQSRDTRPSFTGGDRIFALLFVELGQRFLQRDARFDVERLFGFFAEERRELVPTRLLLEHALELTARRFVIPIEHEQLFERDDCTVRVAQLRVT